MLDFEGWRPDELRGVGTPTLVMAGDRGVVPPEHTLGLFQLLADARLAILPGTDHVSLRGRTDWLLSMLGELLDAPPPEEG